LRKAAKLLDLEQHLTLTEAGDDHMCLQARVLPERSEQVTAGCEQAPDQETARIVNLGIVQIEAALAEGDDGMAALLQSFAGIAGELKAMEQALWDIPPDLAPAELADTLERHREAIAKNVNAAVVGMQFYDQLVQRLSPCTRGVGVFGGLRCGWVAGACSWRLARAWSNPARDVFDAAGAGPV
jgi:hypothetical protein